MNIYNFFSWAAVFIVMGIIFHLSSQVAYESNEISKGVTEIIVETVEKVVPSAELDVKDLNHIIRKNAHFFSYLLLGIFMINALRVSGVGGYKSISLAIALCVLYAISDEVHQLFVPGRGGQIKDVIIDGAGCVVGIMLYLVVSKLIQKKLSNE